MIIYVFYCDPHRFLYFATDTHRQTQTLLYWVVKDYESDLFNFLIRLG